MPDYKAMYYHLAGRMATAIDALEATTNALVEITEKLKLAQQTTEECLCPVLTRILRITNEEGNGQYAVLFFVEQVMSCAWEQLNRHIFHSAFLHTPGNLLHTFSTIAHRIVLTGN